MNIWIHTGHRKLLKRIFSSVLHKIFQCTSFIQEQEAKKPKANPLFTSAQNFQCTFMQPGSTPGVGLKCISKTSKKEWSNGSELAHAHTNPLHQNVGSNESSNWIIHHLEPELKQHKMWKIFKLAQFEQWWWEGGLGYKNKLKLLRLQSKNL